MKGRDGLPVTVLALHHAGGSARSFVPLRRACPAGWRVTTYELAGQGQRRREPRCASVAQAAAEVAARIEAERPDVVLGVSLGALVAVDAVGPRRAGGYRPPRVVLASVAPPSSAGDYAGLQMAELDDAALAEHLVASGKAPSPAVSTPWARETMADLRANLALVLAHRSPALVTDCDLEVWLGQDDGLAAPLLVAAWPSASTGTVKVRVLPGPHLWPVDPARQDDVWALLTGRCGITPPLPPPVT